MSAQELIARLEAATGPCRELDIAILTQVMGYRDVYGDGTMFDRGNEGYWYVGEHSAPQLPAPTASIDAALTLVPEGLDACLSMQLTSSYLGNGQWSHRVMLWDGLRAGINSGEATTGATPALAICIAALKARSND